MDEFYAERRFFPDAPEQVDVDVRVLGGEVLCELRWDFCAENLRLGLQDDEFSV